MFNLEYLLNSLGGKFPELLKKNKVKIVRHTMKNRTDGDWNGFDNLLKFDNALLEVFTAEQRRDCFAGAELILVFVATESTRCLLRGAFWCHGKIEYERFKEKNPKIIEYQELRVKRGIKVIEESERIYYDLAYCDELEEFNNRLVIDWGGATTVWVQQKTDKVIWEIFPVGFISIFPGWDSVLLTHQELKAIIAHPDGNRDWYQFLSEHDGVYVILDKSDGRQYVGSAYGRNGIWGRWAGYAATGHNGNQALIELIKINDNHSDNFMYSIHHVFPQGTKTNNEVIKYESLLKNKLGTRGEGRLNKN